MTARTVPLFVASIFALLAAPATLFASTGSAPQGAHSYGMTFLWLAVILLLAKLSTLVERWGQPAVLGELLVGVALGNLGLLGIHVFESITTNPLLNFWGEVGVAILLFAIGLETPVGTMARVGRPATLVAIVGVALPYVLGRYVAGPLLLPGLPDMSYVFLGAALTATSVGVTMRVFKDLRFHNTGEAQTVLGAAVIDDVIGLVILAVVTAVAKFGTVSPWEVARISVTAILFIVLSIVVGRLVAPAIGRGLSRIHTGIGMKLTLALVFFLSMAALAQAIGLAPIVGAFAAGLLLDPVHFRHFKNPKVVRQVHKSLEGLPEDVRERILKAVEPHTEKHVEDLIEPIGHFFIPVFFVLTGMHVRLDALFRMDVLPLALGVALVAIIGKIAAGVCAAKGTSRLIVGVGMVARGEVGLIFASAGIAIGAIDDRVYAIIVAMVILTTLLPPPVLSMLIRRRQAALA